MDNDRTREYVHFFRPGLSGAEPNTSLSLGEGSVNFYPDSLHEGYLVSYAGRKDFFRRGPEIKDLVGTPPALGTVISRLAVFRDYLGQEHIVCVRGAAVCVVYGNSLRTLVTLTGRNVDGVYYPDLLVHQGKLVIANHGDVVYVWNGVDLVHPLGVTEVPAPPSLIESPVAAGDIVVGTGAWWAWCPWWWTQVEPLSGPALNLDTDGNALWGFYEVVVQYGDDYGNWGVPSPASVVVAVKPTYQVGGVDQHHYLYGDWTPPRVDTHITAVRLARTLNQNPLGGSGVRGVYHVEYVYTGTTLSRFVCQTTDAVLAAGELVDLTAGPPPSCGRLDTWRGRVVAWDGPDPNTLYVMDYGSGGTHRPGQDYQARDRVIQGISLGDRYVVITRSTTDVLYDDGSGLGWAVLEQHPNAGSLYGRSFVHVDGAIFGLWNAGFGYYDGSKWEFVSTPYWLQDNYLDPQFAIYAAVMYGRKYRVSVRLGGTTERNNYILEYDFDTRGWYLLAETTYDLALYRGGLLGCEETIVELDKGTYPSAPVLVIDGYLPPESRPSYQRTLMEVRLLMEPSSTASYTVAVEGDAAAATTDTTSAVAMPSVSAMARESKLLPTWNEAALAWADQPLWSGDRDVWLTPTLRGTTTSYRHRLTITFAAGHAVRIKAIAIRVGEENRAGYS